MKFQRDRRRRIFNWIASGLCFACVIGALVPLGSILYTCIVNGAHVISFQFLVGQEGTGIPANAAGGIGPALYATLVIVALASLIAVPVGILAGIYLSEFGKNPLGRAISFFTDVMTGAPSIVVGLFAYAVFLYFYRADVFSAEDGAVALSILMIPVITRTTEEGLRLVPNALREGAYALGIPRYRSVLQVVLSTGRSIIVTGAILAVMRVSGEVAPLLIAGGWTSHGFTTLNAPVGPLGVLIFLDSDQAAPGLVSAAWGGALVLIALLLGISLLARVLLRKRFT